MTKINDGMLENCNTCDWGAVRMDMTETSYNKTISRYIYCERYNVRIKYPEIRCEEYLFEDDDEDDDDED